MTPSYKYDQDVIRILDSAGRAIGAYEIAQAIPTSDRRPVRAVSVYRSLQRLIEMGQVIKVVSRNGFCRLPGSASSQDHLLLILCCRNCERLEFVWSALSARVRELAQSRAFKFGRAYLECLGICRRCEPKRT